MQLKAGWLKFCKLNARKIEGFKALSALSFACMKITFSSLLCLGGQGTHRFSALVQDLTGLSSSCETLCKHPYPSRVGVLSEPCLASKQGRQLKSSLCTGKTQQNNKFMNILTALLAASSNPSLQTQKGKHPQKECMVLVGLGWADWLRLGKLSLPPSAHYRQRPFYANHAHAHRCQYGRGLKKWRGGLM